MKAIRFVLCLFAALMLTIPNGLAAEEEDFKTFLRKFTSSASFQYSRCLLYTSDAADEGGIV